MKLAFLAAAVGLMLAACAEVAVPTEVDPALRPQMAAVTDKLNLREPLDLEAFVSCANDGAGELVQLSGELHVLIQVTTDNRDGFHLTTHFNPQNVKGVGDAGTIYRAVGVTSDRTNVKAGETYTVRNNFRIIGNGPGNNLQIHQNMHATVNANGDVAAEFEHSTFSCN